MTYSFASLSGEYTRRLGDMVINADQLTECMERAKVILERANEHDQGQVTAATGVPKIWWIASFERESSSNYTTSPAQGDPINRPSTHIPRGLGPYANWFDAAIEAYRLDHFDKIGKGNWTWEMACYKGESFNGFGPRNHGRATGYLWSWSNQYNGGKYVRDGVWSSSAVDGQCGMIPLMKCLLQLDSSLRLDSDAPSTWNLATS